MPRFITLTAALVAVLALAACSAQEPDVTLEDQVPAAQRADTQDDDASAPDDADVFTFEAFDLGFDGPSELPAGSVTIRLDNVGNLPHDITIEELGNRKILDLGGGESDETTVTLEPGTYTFYCSVPGHRNAMEQTVDVVG